MLPYLYLNIFLIPYIAFFPPMSDLAFGVKNVLICHSLNLLICHSLFVASESCRFHFQNGQSSAFEPEFPEKISFKNPDFKMSPFLTSESHKLKMLMAAELVCIRTVDLWKAVCTTSSLSAIKIFIFKLLGFYLRKSN